MEFSSSKIRLALTLGDPEGIGPEIFLKALKSKQVQTLGIELIAIGARTALKKMMGAPPEKKFPPPLKLESSKRPVHKKTYTTFVSAPPPPEGSSSRRVPIGVVYSNCSFTHPKRASRWAHYRPHL